MPERAGQPICEGRDTHTSSNGTSGESASFHSFDCRVTRVHSNRKANKTIVRGAGLPGRRAGRVARVRRPKVIR